MRYDPAINQDNLHKQEPEVVARALQKLVCGNLISEARQIFMEYARAQPGYPEIALHYADILISAGELAEAEGILEEELRKYSHSYHHLSRLALIDEKRGHNLNAFDLYQRAGLLAHSVEQKELVQSAMSRVKNNIKSEIYFEPDSYTIKLSGNRKPLNLKYNLNQLILRKQLLEVLLRNIDPGARSVIEIECDGGVVARNLALCGFEVEGAAAEVRDLMLAIGIDYVEMLRGAYVPGPGYYRMEIDDVTTREINKPDLILLMPPHMEWYLQRGVEKTAAIIKSLLEKAKRQLFIYFPDSVNEKNRDFAGAVLHKLGMSDRGANQPVLCEGLTEEGLLYRFDQKQVLAKDLGFEPPEGLQVSSTRSSVFIVDTELCRSLNGYGFTKTGWHHLTDALEEMLSRSNFTYEGSVLEKYYDLFQPENRRQHLFGEQEGDYQILDRGWAILPWVETRDRRVNSLDSPTLSTGGNPHYGPNSKRFGEIECKRLYANYTLLNKFGYLPEIFPDGYIQGYFLKDGSDYRFYVNEGQHRMAAAGLLGYQKIKARFNPGFLPVVDIKQIRQWPQVKSGLYSKELAEKVFRYYFEEDGRRKARSLGMI